MNLFKNFIKQRETNDLLTAGHVGHLLQFLQDRVHARRGLVHLISKISQHTEDRRNIVILILFYIVRPLGEV